MQAGWRSGNVQAALASSSRLAEAAADNRYRARAAFFYPALVAILALLGAAAFARYVVPTLIGVYREFRIADSPTLRLIESLRTTLPWIATVVVVALIASLLVWLTRRHAPLADAAESHRAPRRADSRGPEFQRRLANGCEQLAALVEAQVPLLESLPLAAEACDEPTLIAAAGAYSVASAQQNAADLQRAMLRFPPFLRWALWQPDESIDRVAALRIAAQVYRDAADRHVERTRLALPMIACIVLGGGATLLYGLLLFIPITNLMQSLAE